MLQAQKKFDYLVFIGRFQPFHIAHQEVIDIAFSKSHNVILVLGSAQAERTTKNPFSASEREQMIRGSYPREVQRHLIFVPIIDLYNDQKWTKAVKEGVQSITQPSDKVGLIGHFKDESSYYLRLFPEWELVELDNLKNALSATPLREKYYEGHIAVQSFSAHVIQMLKDFQKTAIYKHLQVAYEQKDTGVINENKQL